MESKREYMFLRQPSRLNTLTTSRYSRLFYKTTICFPHSNMPLVLQRLCSAMQCRPLISKVVYEPLLLL